MDKAVLDALLPSLLTFSSVGFGVLIAVPRLRFWLKSEFDRRLALGGMRGTEFFLFNYYISITQYMDAFAIIFLVGTLFALLSPFDAAYEYISYWVILVTTATLLTYLTAPIISKLREALSAVEIMSRLPRTLGS